MSKRIKNSEFDLIIASINEIADLTISPEPFQRQSDFVDDVRMHQLRRGKWTSTMMRPAAFLAFLGAFRDGMLAGHCAGLRVAHDLTLEDSGGTKPGHRIRFDIAAMLRNMHGQGDV